MRLRMIHSGANRDSLVTPADAQTFDIMLQLRLQLVRCEPTSQFNVLGTRCNGNGILHDEPLGHFHLVAWTPAEWTAFRTNIVPIIMRYWDRKFELTPSRPWYQPRHGGGAVAARFTCSLSLQLVETAGHAHHRYYIVKPQETSFRSFANGEARRAMFTHRDLSSEWSMARTRVGTALHRVDFRQSTVHEFGHTLGLHHVAGTGSNDAAYGTTLQQRQDIMGWGDHASGTAARPWISQLRHHVIRDHGEAPLTFAARVVSPQLITYWDNDWAPPAAAAHGHAAP